VYNYFKFDFKSVDSRKNCVMGKHIRMSCKTQPHR